MSDFLWLVVGMVAGAVWLDIIYSHKQQKTLDELDAEMRKDLERYRNLSQILLSDVQYLRKRYHTLQKAKEKK